MSKITLVNYTGWYSWGGDKVQVEDFVNRLVKPVIAQHVTKGSKLDATIEDIEVRIANYITEQGTDE